jgi:hypothetical protein
MAVPASKSTPKSPSESGTSSSATAGTAMEGLEVGGFLGYETADFSGVALRVDGELPFRALTEPGAKTQVKLSWVGSLGYSRLWWDYGFGGLGGYKATANVFKLVPAARFSIPLNEKFSVFGDAGLGLVHIGVTVETPSYFVPFFGNVGGGTASYSSTNLMMRIGAGGWFQVNPKLKVGAMLEFDPIFGDFGGSANGLGAQNTWLILGGAMFRL